MNTDIIVALIGSLGVISAAGITFRGTLKISRSKDTTITTIERAEHVSEAQWRIIDDLRDENTTLRDQNDRLRAEALEGN